VKLSPRTIQILKNFNSIEKSIWVKPGNVLALQNGPRSLAVRAIVDSEFDKEFAIYDLSRFLGVLSLFNDPDLEFGEKQVVVSDSSQRVNYTYAKTDFLNPPLNKKIVLSQVDAKFTLTPIHLSNVMKSLSILELPELFVSGDGSNILLQAGDIKTPSSDTYSAVVGQTDKNFRYVFNPDNIKFISDTYEVELSSIGISHFKAENLEYWVATELTSTYSK
jgi:hypothetical protein